MRRRKDYIGRPSDPVCLVEDAPTVDAVPVKHWWKDSIACSKLEKVIQGLECCYVDNCSEESKCPYYREEYCLNTLMYDALKLLKEQEPPKEVVKWDD